ncbi:hypothetical protein MCEMRE182_01207 [Candidatus Nanopelagicaceae bacterium]
MKKFLAILIGVAVLGGSASSVSAADIPGEQFSIQGPADGVPSAGVVIEDSQFIKNHFASLQGFTSANSVRDEKPLSLTDCTSYGTSSCTDKMFYNYKAFFGNCVDSNSHDCVLSVTAKSADGSIHKAKFVEDFPGKTQYSYVGSPEANLPDGGSSFIVSIPTLPHSHGDLYLVTVNVDGSKEFNSPRFTINDFRAGIFAVSVVNGSYTTSHPNTDVQNVPFVGQISNQRVAFDNSIGKISGCAQATRTRCALAWPLPENVEFSMALKLRTNINGWIHGRLNDVSATIGQASDGDQLVTVSGKPVVVPTVFQWFHLDSLPSSVTKFYANQPRFMTQGTGFGGTSFGNSTSILKDYIGYTVREFPEAIAWYNAIGDKANSTATAWSFRTIESNNLPQKCNSKENALTGIVTTNSNMFVAAPPDFNKEDQSLDYKVSSPHFLPDGSVFKGTYNLVMRSDYARCLYGFTSAPVSASVSILSADGTSQVATTVLGERDGWLYLSANNFTFSSPTLKVKLMQEIAPKPEMTTQAVAPVAGAAKKTITCVKGKVTKKVTGSNPTCPSGYKKKAA